MDDIITLQGLLGAALRRWWLVLGAFLLTTAAAAVLILVQTPLYESDAVLLVKFGREFVYQPEVGDRATPIANRNQETLINSEIRILQSDNLIQSVLKSVGVERVYPPQAQNFIQGFLKSLIARVCPPPAGSPQPSDVPDNAAVLQFRQHFIVEAVPTTDVIDVSFTHPEPRVAVAVLDRVLEVFKESHLQAFSDPGVPHFLEAKVAESRGKLEKCEEGVRTFQVQNRDSLDQGELLLHQREVVEAGIKEVDNQIAGLREKLVYLQYQAHSNEQADGVPLQPERDPAVTQAKAHLLELQLTEQKLLASFKESSRQVVSVRKQIDLVKEFLRDQEQGGMNAELGMQIVSAKADLHFQEAKRTSVRRQLDELNAQLEALPRVEESYNKLKRECDSFEKNYQNYKQKLEEARVSQEMDEQKIANISVIQKPGLPSVPVSPRKLLNLAVGMFVGAVLGVSLAFVTDSFGSGKTT